MRIFRSLEEVPTDFGPSVVSVGNFDGVHRGHQQVLAEMVRRARETGTKAVAVTFDPHPLRILRPDVAPKLISPPEQKEALLAQSGLDALLVAPFTRDFSLTTPRDFARSILADKLHATEVYEGSNFRFGHKGAGDVACLTDFGRELGFQVKVYPMMLLRGEPVSSSRIRELLATGTISLANRLLGRPFSVTAFPGSGRGYGHKYTVPTINLGRYDELTPANGVYVTRTRVAGETFNSVTNVGTRPTFENESFAIETHLFDFHPLELAAQTEVEISFCYRLRSEIKFPSPEALKQQIGKDVKRTKRYFSLKSRA
ncbi:MAG TPA: bifunctional riboflavin kinase/FAD synthetase [Verrucomicrobiae bacterium]|jgi:riboflavin kinase/FMN adenylyltransferase|nr:bifunctional riboflavin kinase/FAD synthetase [Verrucomicrobiae bacterium]